MQCYLHRNRISTTQPQTRVINIHGFCRGTVSYTQWTFAQLWAHYSYWYVMPRSVEAVKTGFENAIWEGTSDETTPGRDLAFISLGSRLTMCLVPF